MSMVSGDLSAQDAVRLQRTHEGVRYEKMRGKLASDLREKEFRARRDAEVWSIKGVAPGSVHSNTFLSNVSLQYANDEFIGERLMPVVPVTKRSDSWPTYPKRERLAGPDDLMGERSEANELNETRGSDNYSVSDYALKNFVAGTTIENQDGAFNEMADLTEALLDVLALKREKRIATVLTTAANFSGNTVTLAGADQWNSAGGGDPIKQMQDAHAACWHGRGPGDFWGYASLDVWNVIARHAATRDLFKYVTSGLVTPTMVAAEVGLAGILIGAAREDTANSGQTAAYSRIWGKHFGIVRVARRPTLRNAAFGYTVRLAGDPVTNQWYDPAKGKAGGYYSQVGFSEQHKVAAGDTGYFIKDCIA